MAPPDYLPILSVFLIISGAVLAGPVLGLPREPSGDACTVDGFPGNGNASVSVTHLPDSAIIEQAQFGAEVWRLKVPNAQINVSDIKGRPTVAYKITLHELTRTTGSATIISRCHPSPELNIRVSTFEPDTITQESYNATLTVTYRGSNDGEKVEEILATRNISVEVDE